VEAVVELGLKDQEVLEEALVAVDLLDLLDLVVLL
jgi:hypothetical protein